MLALELIREARSWWPLTVRTFGYVISPSRLPLKPAMVARTESDLVMWWIDVASTHCHYNVVVNAYIYLFEENLVDRGCFDFEEAIFTKIEGKSPKVPCQSHALSAL